MQTIGISHRFKYHTTIWTNQNEFVHKVAIIDHELDLTYNKIDGKKYISFVTRNLSVEKHEHSRWRTKNSQNCGSPISWLNETFQQLESQMLLSLSWPSTTCHHQWIQKHIYKPKMRTMKWEKGEKIYLQEWLGYTVGLAANSNYKLTLELDVPTRDEMDPWKKHDILSKN